MMIRTIENSNIARLEDLLRAYNIVEPSENFECLAERVFSSIIEKEFAYLANESEAFYFKERMKMRFYDKEIVPSTSILTNAGRYKDKPLAACSVPPLSLKEDYKKIKDMVNAYHQKGMGTGFNFDECEDPLALIEFLNQTALNGQNSGKEDRPVGNMAVISCDHPKIEEVIKYKSGKNKDKKWLFNISVNLKKDFMDALEKNEKYCLRDGTQIKPDNLLDLIAEMACDCGDPGVLFLERFEKDNPVPHLGRYKSLAPCGEVALAEGETCQFSYINVGKFLKGGKIDYNSLAEVVFDTVRFLDDALDVSIENYGNEKSKKIMESKRKIGVGICGFADLLIKLGIPYDSEQTEKIAENLMSFINFTSKKASVELAKQRGAFPAFYDKRSKLGKGYIVERYGSLETETVSKEDWKALGEDIAKYGIRHVSTTALPPTGRSSNLIEASPSIEPYFYLVLNSEMREGLVEKLKVKNFSSDEISEIVCLGKNNVQVNKTLLPYDLRGLYKTCLEISPERQLRVVASFQKFVDESISKTINMAEKATPQEIKEVYFMAYTLGLKGMTVYRNNSKIDQPKMM